MEIKNKPEHKLIISKIKGGLGNQLFQYATGLSLAIKNNAEYKLDISFYKDLKYSKTWRLNSFNILYNEATEEEINALKNFKYPAPLHLRILGKIGFQTRFKKKTHIYDSFGHKPSTELLNVKASAYIEGWCVKEVYFNNNIKIISKLFTPKNPLSIKSQEILKKINSSNSVSIHIRRGDYVNNDYFETLGIDYYSKAISIINSKVKNAQFFVFSNDVDWVKVNFSSFKNIVIVDFNSEEESEFNTKGDIDDMTLMRECKHNIIANSSFSWWPAWLNDNPIKIVIYPNKWYSDIKAQKDFLKHTFMPKDWIKI